MNSQAYARYPNLAPHVVAALPAYDAEPETVRKIFERTGTGSISSVRIILNIFESEGLVISIYGPRYGNRDNPAKLWRHASYRPPHNISEEAARFIVEVVG